MGDSGKTRKGKAGGDNGLQDLCQMVYELLLTYDEAKIIDLWESGALGFFIARVLTTQYRSPRSTFYNLIRKFSAKSEEIDERTG